MFGLYRNAITADTRISVQYNSFRSRTIKIVNNLKYRSIKLESDDEGRGAGGGLKYFDGDDNYTLKSMLI